MSSSWTARDDVRGRSPGELFPLMFNGDVLSVGVASRDFRGSVVHVTLVDALFRIANPFTRESHCTPVPCARPSTSCRGGGISKSRLIKIHPPKGNMVRKHQTRMTETYATPNERSSGVNGGVDASVITNASGMSPEPSTPHF